MTSANADGTVRSRLAVETPPPEAEEGEAWLMTYTDMVTLLLTVFVALLALAHFDPPLELERDREVGHAETAEPATQPQDGLDGQQSGPLVVSSGGQQARPVGEGEETLRRLRLFVNEQGLSGDVDVQVDRGIVQLNLRTAIPFADDSIALDVPAHTLIAKLAPILGRVEGRILVQGHTDGAPPGAASPYVSNWALSAARAAAVAESLFALGIDPDRLSVVGLADTRPVSDETAPEGAARNRRVTISLRQE